MGLRIVESHGYWVVLRKDGSVRAQGGREMCEAVVAGQLDEYMKALRAGRATALDQEIIDILG